MQSVCCRSHDHEKTREIFDIEDKGWNGSSSGEVMRTFMKFLDQPFPELRYATFKAIQSTEQPSLYQWPGNNLNFLRHDFAPMGREGDVRLPWIPGVSSQSKHRSDEGGKRMEVRNHRVPHSTTWRKSCARHPRRGGSRPSSSLLEPRCFLPARRGRLEDRLQGRLNTKLNGKNKTVSFYKNANYVPEMTGIWDIPSPDLKLADSETGVCTTNGRRGLIRGASLGAQARGRAPWRQPGSHGGMVRVTIILTSGSQPSTSRRPTTPAWVYHCLTSSFPFLFPFSFSSLIQNNKYHLLYFLFYPK